MHPGILALITTVLVFGSVTQAQSPTESSIFATPPTNESLSPEVRRRIDSSVERGLEFLSQQQKPDGSFPSAVSGQPAVTSLCVKAFLSAGDTPGNGPYGKQLEKGINYVLNCQEANGLLNLDDMPFSPDSRIVFERRPHVATYNHAISGIMLCEAYGQSGAELDSRLKPAIKRALVWSRQLQKTPSSL